MATLNSHLTGSNRTSWTLAAALLLAAPGFAGTPPAAPQGAVDGPPLADARASSSFRRTA